MTTNNQTARNLMTALGPDFQTLVKVSSVFQMDGGSLDMEGKGGWRNGGIQIKFAKGQQGINMLRMSVNERDTIDMHFWRITSKAHKEIVAVGDLQTREEVQGVFENITGFAVHF